MDKVSKIKESLLFSFNGVPKIKEIIPMGLQHVVAAVVGIITPALLVSNACGLNSQDTTMLVQSSLIISAIAIAIQIFPFWKIGSGLPVIYGVSFAYVPTLLAISGNLGISAVLGAQIAGGIAALIVGFFIDKLRVLFPPIVAGTVVFTIGLSLYPTAVKYMAGGAGSPSFGSPQNWMVAMITLICVIFFGNFTKGFLKLSSILSGMVIGYIVALFLGMVSFNSVAQAGWFEVSTPLHFGLKFDWVAIVSMVIMFIVNAVQTIGDLSATTVGGMDRQPTDKELSGGIIGSSLCAVLGAFIGGMPVSSFSQNVGIVTVTRVINKFVFAFAAAVLLLAGFIPKFASLLTTIPSAVIGGATISVFASIAMTGIKIIVGEKLTPRTLSVVGLSVALGIGVTQAPGSLALFPDWVNTVFGGSAVVLSTITAIILNLVLPKNKDVLENKSKQN